VVGVKLWSPARAKRFGFVPGAAAESIIANDLAYPRSAQQLQLADA